MFCSLGNIASLIELMRLPCHISKAVADRDGISGLGKCQARGFIGAGQPETNIENLCL